MEILKPSLVEPTFKYFTDITLKRCHKFKEQYSNFFFNIIVFILFIGGISILLINRYKGKLNTIDIDIKNRKKQEYIISKLQQLALIKKQNNDKLITDLPNFQNLYT